MSKYEVISGPYFRVFGLNTGKYGPEIRNNSVFGHFSRSEREKKQVFPSVLYHKKDVGDKVDK